MSKAIAAEWSLASELKLVEELFLSRTSYIIEKVAQNKLPIFGCLLYAYENHTIRIACNSSFIY